MDVLEYSPIASSPKVLGGALVFVSTRVPVQSLLDYMNDGYTPEQFIEFFPSVRLAYVKGFLKILKRSPE